MKKPYFTPGPWNVCQDGKKKGAVVGKDGIMVCDPSGSGLYEDEWQGNAALIAAAPDMLALLEEIARSGKLTLALYAKCKTVMKKARGEQ